MGVALLPPMAGPTVGDFFAAGFFCLDPASWQSALGEAETVQRARLSSKSNLVKRDACLVISWSVWVSCKKVGCFKARSLDDLEKGRNGTNCALCSDP